MADITVCTGKNCPLRESCHRYTAPHGLYQSFIEAPYDVHSGTCDLFWDNKDYPDEYRRLDQQYELSEE